jgi:hypothetical protein
LIALIARGTEKVVSTSSPSPSNLQDVEHDPELVTVVGVPVDGLQRAVTMRVKWQLALGQELQFVERCAYHVIRSTGSMRSMRMMYFANDCICGYYFRK